ncbi:MAG: hypothetical protein J5I67_12860 [Ignavibacterium album]|nr:hypothetical protein [Ignavibacterium album]
MDRASDYGSKGIEEKFVSKARFHKEFGLFLFGNPDDFRFCVWSLYGLVWTPKNTGQY